MEDRIVLYDFLSMISYTFQYPLHRAARSGLSSPTSSVNQENPSRVWLWLAYREV